MVRIRSTIDLYGKGIYPFIPVALQAKSEDKMDVITLKGRLQSTNKKFHAQPI